jgi:hypothetical protein
LREVHKDLGTVASIVAEHFSDARRQQEFLEVAEEQLRACVETLDATEVASPFDHNNLADFYRQLGEHAQPTAATPYYKDARGQMKLAFDVARPGDPAFHHTLAMIHRSEKDYPSGFNVLCEYTAALATAGDDQDVEQYVGNQILAAQLAAQLSPQEAGLQAAVRLLEEANGFVELVRGRLGKSYTDLKIQIREFLGFAYLQTPRREADALAAFREVMTLAPGDRRAAAKYRSRVGYVNASGRRARILRRESALSQGARLLEEAQPHLDAVLTYAAGATIDGATPAAAREARIRQVLDAVRAAQLIAEEYFAGHETIKANALAARIGPLLSMLQGALQQQAGTAVDGAIRQAARRVAARHALLSARLLVRADPTVDSADTVGKVEQMLRGAKGVAPEFDCQAELELGALLLTAARLGKGDADKHYKAAVLALERAIEPDAPQLRTEAIRQLSLAYGMRGMIRRKGKGSAAE